MIFAPIKRFSLINIFYSCLMRIAIFTSLILVVYLLTGCSYLVQCQLVFANYIKTYNFNIPKKDLKDKIVEAYTYDESRLLTLFGKTTITNEDIDKAQQQHLEIWIDKKNWDTFKSEIRKNTTDTLTILIGKHLSNTQIRLQAVIQGDQATSSLTINGFRYQKRSACQKENAYYIQKLSKKIEKKFINKIR